MHESVQRFVGDVVRSLDLSKRTTLEVGSLNVNGSVRPLFKGTYVGVDMQAGRGVDQVVNAHALERAFPLPIFEVVVSTEMLEHDDQPWESVRQMRLVAAPKAILILTCRGYDQRGCFPLHSYPEDLWRFSPEGLRRMLLWAGWEDAQTWPDPADPGAFALASAPACLRSPDSAPAWSGNPAEASAQAQPAPGL